MTGLDADPEVLARARRKAADAGCEIDFVEGFSTELPFANDSFDVVLSSLFFHHLMPADKRSTLAEVQRVLKPGGKLHVADWGKPGDPLMAALSLSIRAFDGFEVTAENLRGALPSLFEQAGLENAQERRRLRTTLGTLALYSARKPRLMGWVALGCYAVYLALAFVLRSSSSCAAPARPDSGASADHRVRSSGTPGSCSAWR